MNTKITPELQADALAFEKDPKREMTLMLLEAADMARREQNPAKAARALCRVVRTFVKLYGVENLRATASTKAAASKRPQA